MTATTAISALRVQLRCVLDAESPCPLRQWAARGKQKLMEWLRRAHREEGLTVPVSGGAPVALPGFNQEVVERTWWLSGQRMPYTDGRQRLAGEQTLDVCATPQHMARAIASFACWLDYLAADGIGVEIRKVDAWRTCAMVNGVPVPIRIRERMRRVSGANRLSARLEKLLGGHIPSVLVPSGKLELQLLRMGVAFASFPLPGMPTPALLEAVSKSIRAMAKREVEYRERMHAAAVAETAARRSQPGARTSGPMKGREFLAETPVLPGEMPLGRPPAAILPSAAEMTLLSAYSAARLAQMLEMMQRAWGEASAREHRAHGGNPASAAESNPGQMVESMVSLAKAIHGPEPTRQADTPAPTGVAMITEGNAKGSKSRRGRRSRVA